MLDLASPVSWAVILFIIAFVMALVLGVALMLYQRGLRRFMKFPASFEVPAADLSAAKPHYEALLRKRVPWLPSTVHNRVGPAPTAHAPAVKAPQADAAVHVAQELVEVKVSLESAPNVPTPVAPEIVDSAPPRRPSKATIKGARVVISEHVRFEDKNATVLDSAQVLDDVATVMIENGHIKRFRIEGHTDTDPLCSDKEMSDLSKARANAVKLELVARGVAANRLLVEGFGNTLNFAPNDTPAGRALNRRVDFVVLADGADGGVLDTGALTAARHRSSRLGDAPRAPATRKGL